MTEVLRATVQVTAVGTPVGVTTQGGILEQPLFEIEIECQHRRCRSRFRWMCQGSRLETPCGCRLEGFLDEIRILTEPEIALFHVVAPRKVAEPKRPRGLRRARPRTRNSIAIEWDVVHGFGFPDDGINRLVAGGSDGNLESVSNEAARAIGDRFGQPGESVCCDAAQHRLGGCRPAGRREGIEKDLGMPGPWLQVRGGR